MLTMRQALRSFDAKEKAQRDTVSTNGSLSTTQVSSVELEYALRQLGASVNPENVSKIVDENGKPMERSRLLQTNHYTTPLYTVEAVEIERPAGQSVLDTSEKALRNTPLTGLDKKIRQMVDSVNSISKIVDENGEPLLRSRLLQTNLYTTKCSCFDFSPRRSKWGFCL